LPVRHSIRVQEKDRRVVSLIDRSVRPNEGQEVDEDGSAREDERNLLRRIGRRLQMLRERPPSTAFIEPLQPMIALYSAILSRFIAGCSPRFDADRSNRKSTRLNSSHVSISYAV